ncbi:MAG: DUF4080 domain-containing protein [Tissierellia bacterium]|nr:DUF4080 domain-containing protein [Tissierellia bacterium]
MKIILSTLNAKYIHSNLAIQYIKQYSKEFDIDIYEYNINQELDLIVREIHSAKPNIVCFSTYIWNINETLEICSKLKKVNKDLIIVLGGPEVSFTQNEIMLANPFIDFIIEGEGEITTDELFNYLVKKNRVIEEIDGVTYRKEDEIIINKPRPLIENLDIIPTPFNDMEYSENKIVYYETSRGCPFNCQFCLSSTIKGLRFFSKERVESDLLILMKSGIKQVKFVDRTFNANQKYAMELMTFIMENAPKGMNFHFEVTAHLITDEFLEFLKDVKKGLFQFEIGIQSSNPKTLQASGRTTDLEKLSYVIKKVNSYGNIHQHLDLIIGLPYEGYDSFRESFNFVYNLDGEKLQLGFLKLLKGSGLLQKADMYGFVYADEAPYEIMETNDLNFDEIIALKLLEDVVEKYHNERYFYHTNKFMIANYYETPFDYFEALSQFWGFNDYEKVAHSRNSLYAKLFEFAKHIVKPQQIGLISEILAFDFLSSNNQLPFDYMGTERIPMADIHDILKREEVLQELDELSEIPTKRVVPKVKIEKFHYDIERLIESNYLDIRDSIEIYGFLHLDQGIKQISVELQEEGRYGQN